MEETGLTPGEIQALRVYRVKTAIESVPRNSEIKSDRADDKPITTLTATTVEIPLAGDKPAISIEDASRIIDGVHIDIWDFFDMKSDLSQASDKSKLRDIHNWAWKDSINSFEAFRKMNNLISRLGNNCLGEVKLVRFHSQIKMLNLADRFYGDIPIKSNLPI